MLKESELPKLPDGWEWRSSEEFGFTYKSWMAMDQSYDGACCYMGSDGLHVDSLDSRGCTLEVIAAVLFSNGVTLPEIPGHSTILGGK